MPPKLSSEATERFIEEVRKYDFLYNPASESYKNIRVKSETWTTIAMELGLTNGDEAKALWKKLRDSYGSARMRRIKKTGSARKTMKQWKFENQMSFLKDIMQHNENTSWNITADIPPEEENEDSDSDQADDPSVDTSIPQTSSLANSDSGSSSSRGKKWTATATVDEALVNYINNKAAKKSENKRPADALQTFFQSTYLTVKALPVQQQIKIKKQISDILYEAEIDAHRSEAITETTAAVNNSRTSNTTEKDKSDDIDGFIYETVDMYYD